MATMQLIELFYLCLGREIATARGVHSFANSGSLFVRQLVFVIATWFD